MVENGTPAVDDTSDAASDNELDEIRDTKMSARRDSDEPLDKSGDAPAKPKYDPKDPSRPRRKKARRACFACQRAHLTCGDERPCQRCIKRGIAGGCEDGVRKKAKYLHDAPPEALRPVLGPAFNQLNNGSANSPTTNDTNASVTTNGRPSTAHRGSISENSNVGGFFTPNNATQYPMFRANRQNSMVTTMPDAISFNSQQSPMSPEFQSSASQRAGSIRSLSGPLIQPPTTQTGLSSTLLDPTNPSLLNFDIEGYNFGNQYGAMEFGMLGHISSGAAETPPHENGMAPAGDVRFGGTGPVFGPNVNNFMYTAQGTLLPEFMDQNGLFASELSGLPHAYAIATGPTSMQSPSTDNSPQPSTMFDSPKATTYNVTTPHAVHATPAVKPQKREKAKSGHGLLSKNRDPSSIYETVQQPYSYTAGFHNLTAYIVRRFSRDQTLRIAKHLASIRPSFISCTKALNRQDLIFMEKCFQRTLFEYEDFMVHCCTPTIVCRRTGEVAAVNKEFTLLTGWTQDVLLGHESNLNINTGRSAPPTTTGSEQGSANNSGRAGLPTPRLRHTEITDHGRPQPVFLAELLDDDSVIQFYEDFAKLAFGDSRGSVTNKCNLLKYQPKEPIPHGDDKTDGRGPQRKDVPDSGDPPGGLGGLGSRLMKIDGENGIGRLQKDGKLQCTYCWTVKRDVFDIPMLIVMNFLPCI